MMAERQDLVPGNGSSWLLERSACRKTHGKSSTCALQSEPVYNHYLLAADSSRKVDRLGESTRKSMDKIVISPNEITR